MSINDVHKISMFINVTLPLFSFLDICCQLADIN